MKQLIYLAVSIQIALISCSGGGHKAISVKDSNVIVNDTFFIKRDIYKDTVNYELFIDSNKKPLSYDWVYNWDKMDSTNIKDYLTTIHKKHITLKKFDTYGLPVEWRPVYKFIPNIIYTNLQIRAIKAQGFYQIHY